MSVTVLNMSREVVIYMYMLLTLVTGLWAIWQGEILAGIAGIVGPTLCWFAASSLKGSLLMGDSRQKLGASAGATVVIAAALGSVYYADYWIELWSLAISGVIWCGVGFIVGWVSTTPSQAIAMKA
jgi:hypothetical protein